MNASQAAIRAGYSEKTAYSAGQRLLKHVEVSSELEAAQKELSVRSEVTVDMVVEELGAIAFSETESARDKIRALELLGKVLGMFIDRSVSATIELEPGSLGATAALVASICAPSSPQDRLCQSS